MLYLGIDQHARQITISLRDACSAMALVKGRGRPGGLPKDSMAADNMVISQRPSDGTGRKNGLLWPKGPITPVQSMERPHARCTGFQHRDIADILPVA